MEMNMLGWSSEAGNPNIQDLKENWQKRREKPSTDVAEKALKFKLQEQLRKLHSKLTPNIEISTQAFLRGIYDI